ncbi:SDR family NAD(P)-dependent oxidoreductase [Amycolatopsis sp. NPDC004368]
MTGTLTGKIAVVTGATRGVGKGIALELGAAGATVYVTGRTTSPGPLPGTVAETAAEITALGGTGVAVPCDHHDDAQVEAVFTRVASEAGRLDVLVNNVFSAPDLAAWLNRPFWGAAARGVGRGPRHRRPLALRGERVRRTPALRRGRRPDRQHLLPGRGGVPAEHRVRRR